MSWTTFITAEELGDQIAQGRDLLLFDVRFWLAAPEQGRQVYAESHIPGAIYAHLNEDLSGPVVAGRTGRHPLPDPDAFARRMAAWGLNSGMQVVAYDQLEGGIAARLWWMLRWLGQSQAAVLDGGWQAWLDAGFPVIREVPQPRPGDFRAQLQPGMAVEFADIPAMRSEAGARIVDSRTADRYAGHNETIDPIAGHIPGAIHSSYLDTAGPDGRSLPPAALQARFRSLLQGADPARTAFYCGSGVTACRNILAMEAAGLHGSLLYAGSWSEWIARGGGVSTEDV